MREEDYVRSAELPGELRKFDNGELNLVTIGDSSFGRGVFQPGWRWSNDVKPIVQTDTCQVRHVGYCIQGEMVIRLDDGTELTVQSGDVMDVPPGHDAWVTSDEACILIDVIGGTTYATAPD